MALPVAQIMAQIQEVVSDDVIAEAQEKAYEALEAVDEAEEMMEEAEDMVATSATYSFSKSDLSGHEPAVLLFFCRKISWLLVSSAGAPVVVTVLGV